MPAKTARGSYHQVGQVGLSEVATLLSEGLRFRI